MEPDAWVKPVRLEGRHILLEPLALNHASALWRAAEPEIFSYHSLRPEDESQGAFEVYIQRSLGMPGRLPFAIVLKAQGDGQDERGERAIGTTSYMDIRPDHRGLEIGYTWIARSCQGAYVNPECKYLLLRHAFQTLGAIRVQLKTDGRNLHSQRAIEKLGAKREGTLRKHMVMPDGYIRDTVMFSITDDEWLGVRASLEARLGYVP